MYIHTYCKIVSPSVCVCSSIAVWAVVKKKPLVKALHNSATEREGEREGEEEGEREGEREGEEEEEGEGEGEGEGEKVKEVGSGWVTAVAALPNTDLVASGQNYICIHRKCVCV